METNIEFRGIVQNGEYLFANVDISLGASDDDSIGYTNVRLSVPVVNRDHSFVELREQSLSLARETIQIARLVEWMDVQRKAQIQKK